MNKIAIISNFQFNELYSHSKSFYEHMLFPSIGVKGDNGFYSFKFLNYIITDDKYKDIDIMIYRTERKTHKSLVCGM